MKASGAIAEQMAARYLQQKGLQLIEQNYQTRYGEIDLIMRDGKTLVFVEVRLRSNPGFGGAAMSITLAKQQKIIRSAEHYLQTHGNANCRFDVVLMQSTRESEMEWISHAFEAS